MPASLAVQQTCANTAVLNSVSFVNFFITSSFVLVKSLVTFFVLNMMMQRSNISGRGLRSREEADKSTMNLSMGRIH